ncbi:hypothetical protein P168DRAFT_292128 [Aspergillus campestris IBT 28561]|uniref:GRF-like zinc ribbon domain-containing protein n=1 Tax=Aspergillus campestris (strain IBT 28561) TaxID=1392248 RepID=A0A2I1CWK1_ASPC2|nr:uncharacterized protein P168DRAFT_292128 [Aspergillus campestris IBT 28561]PKY02003.1 hypothetical protein P168DRAFT_292128 [Aspergillus campestris IBT 28561]
MSEEIPRLFEEDPSCRNCNSIMVRNQTHGNANGNENRWFYKCRRRECRGIVFDDYEGIREGNPPCDCDEFSRVQREQGRDYVFRCARGECEFVQVY